jgi:hypothetical protein
LTSTFHGTRSSPSRFTVAESGARAALDEEEEEGRAVAVAAAEPEDVVEAVDDGASSSTN